MYTPLNAQHEVSQTLIPHCEKVHKMKIGSTFHILVFLIVVLVFSMPSVTCAQQNSELAEAIIAAEQDAKAAVNQDRWWFYGSCLLGVTIAAAEPQLPQVSAAKLTGKSPEYVEAYTQAYKAKVKNLRSSAAVPGCLTTVFSVLITWVVVEVAFN